MASVIQKNFRVRKNFAKLQKVIDIPNLIDIQKRSYDKFLQSTIPPADRQDVGLQGVFNSVFPIKDFSETSSLEFVSYNLERPKYDVEECRARGMTYAATVKVVIRLVVWDVNEETGLQSIRDVKEQEVYFGDIPLMTESGTFIVNGSERVIVSQLHRSPGVFFDHDKRKDPLVGQAAVLGPGHPLPRLVARLRVRSQGPAVRPHRPAPQAARLVSCCALSATPPKSCSTTTTTPRPSTSRAARSTRGRSTTSCFWASEPLATSATRRAARSWSARTASSPARRSASSQDSKVERLPIDIEELVGKVSAQRRHRRDHR